MLDSLYIGESCAIGLTCCNVEKVAANALDIIFILKGFLFPSIIYIGCSR